MYMPYSDQEVELQPLYLNKDLTSLEYPSKIQDTQEFKSLEMDLCERYVLRKQMHMNFASYRWYS